MPTTKLTSDVFVTAMHPNAHRDVETGTLSAGSLVRCVRIIRGGVDENGDPCTLTHFEASTDGGVHWYPHRCTGELPTDAFEWDGRTTMEGTDPPASAARSTLDDG